MIQETVSFKVILNGTLQAAIDLPSHWRLIDYLHEIKNLTGTKFGCGSGYCKACTVCTKDDNGHYRAIPSCSTSLDVCNGWEILTIESIGNETNLHPLQQAVIDNDGLQCGYCTPGFLMEAFALYENLRGKLIGQKELEQQIAGAVDAHLCRCTGYQRYYAAFKDTLGSVVQIVPAASRLPLPSTDSDDDRLSTDPRWELIRLLHEAAEVENALMLQYLYAAFSLKRPLYASLAGFGHRTPGKPLDFLAIAIEEMLHLDVVNRFLVAIGGRPNLIRQDYPWEPEIYPFEFSLEPLSLHTLSKYIYAEAAQNAIDNDPPVNEIVGTQLPPGAIVNRVGSVYRRIRNELSVAKQAYPSLTDWDAWDVRLDLVTEEGETDHYQFFRSVLLGLHPALQVAENPWLLPVDHPMHPVIHYYKNPTAYPGHPNTLPSELVCRLAMLANRHYWLTMGLLEVSYVNNGRFHPAARRHMAGPLLQLAWHLSETYGTPVTFDKFSMEFYVGRDHQSQLQWLVSLLRDIRNEENKLAGHLPSAYVRSSGETLGELMRILE